MTPTSTTTRSTAATAAASPPRTSLDQFMAESKRLYNFSAGPAVMPEQVLQQAQRDIWSIFDSGIGIMEHSHRGPVFDRVIAEAEQDCRTLAGISDDYAVLFLQGGATTQFALIPMNFLPDEQTADYLDTGVWTTKAIREARTIGKVHVAFEGARSKYDHTPDHSELDLSPDAAYVHYCSNNTIFGTQFPTPPAVERPLIADMSSDMFSRPIDINAHAMLYAGAQKNLGPAGTVLAIIRRGFLDSARDGLPSMFDYRQHADAGSCLNTPPTFGIYLMGQMFKWILHHGGLDAIHAHNQDKARLIYSAIDSSGDFYQPVSQPQCRSLMNISFRTPNETLDQKFLDEAAAHDMSGLKGHRSAGGLRASIYNAFPRKGCEVLAQFMRDFAERHG